MDAVHCVVWFRVRRTAKEGASSAHNITLTKDTIFPSRIELEPSALSIAARSSFWKRDVVPVTSASMDKGLLGVRGVLSRLP